MSEDFGMGMGIAIGDFDWDFGIVNDPWRFGNEYWPTFVQECRAPKASEKGLYGMYVFFEIAHERYEHVKRFGRWIQLPTPKAVQEQFGTTFDPENNIKDANVYAFAIKFFLALGFSVDEIKSGRITPPLIQGRVFEAQYSVGKNDNGFEEPRWRNPRVMPKEGSEEGYEAFAAQSQNTDASDAAIAASQRKSSKSNNEVADAVENAG